MRKYINPWLYVPTAYFAEGLPYALVNILVVVLYKKLNVPNDVITFLTSWLFLPWTVKFLWGPTVDLTLTKRRWIYLTQAVMAVAVLIASVFLGFKSYLYPTLVMFMIVAFMSATHDIAVDGFYMISMDDKEQAYFVGIRAFFYRIAMLFSSGVLLIWVGKLELSTNSVVKSWQVLLTVIAFIMAFFSLYHRIILPYPDNDKPSEKFNWQEFWDSFKTYFKQDKIVLVISFIILYRFGEAMLLKVTPLFFLDSIAKGGLGINTELYGKIYGTFGLISLIIGNIIGGFFIARWGLKKCIWPMALLLNLPDLVYVYMAYHQNLPVYYLYALVALEQFGYGVGTTAYMYYLIQITGEKYKTTHFAISTSIMAMGLMIPGMISGKLQMMLGYPKFFILAFILTVPGMLLIPFLKYKN